VLKAARKLKYECGELVWYVRAPKARQLAIVIRASIFYQKADIVLHEGGKLETNVMFYFIEKIN